MVLRKTRHITDKELERLDWNRFTPPLPVDDGVKPNDQGRSLCTLSSLVQKRLLQRIEIHVHTSITGVGKGRVEVAV